ncbi:hypothetical protein V493_06121, partial [Pseudogymnoascus sp. VKM F-4281 (FW-2241)]
MKTLGGSERDAETSDDMRAQGNQQTADSQPEAEHHDSSEKPPARDASLRSTSSPSFKAEIADVAYNEKDDGSTPSTLTNAHLALNGQSPITYHYLTFAT